MADRQPLVQGNIAMAPPAPQGQPLQNADLKRASDFLLDNVRSGSFKTHYDKYRRYADLNAQDMFDQLVQLYETVFYSQWQHFRRLCDAFGPYQAGLTAQRYAARVYISHWFYDLYCTNREATKVISPIAFNEIYHHEVMPYSRTYDAFLALLNASIRPTHIQLTSEDVLYIPRISATYNWTTAPENAFNPFGITHFVLNHDLFHGLLKVMRDRKDWKLTELSTHSMGRPCWLFDWHEADNAAAWFPMEGNYNQSDVALAYIIGVACTPKLAPRDFDDWITPENQQAPAPYTYSQLVRSRARSFYGSYEYRTVEIDENHFPSAPILNIIEQAGTETTKKRKVRKTTDRGKQQGGSTSSSALVIRDPTPPAEPSSSTTQFEEIIIPPTLRYRITDWCYYARVILNLEWHTRTGAHRIITLS